jgi:hypothetical protein
LSRASIILDNIIIKEVRGSGMLIPSVEDPDPHVLCLPDPDPLVRGMDPAPHKGVERTEIMLAK